MHTCTYMYAHVYYLFLGQQPCRISGGRCEATRWEGCEEEGKEGEEELDFADGHYLFFCCCCNWDRDSLQSAAQAFVSTLQCEVTDLASQKHDFWPWILRLCVWWDTPKLQLYLRAPVAVRYPKRMPNFHIFCGDLTVSKAEGYPFGFQSFFFV